ncbi:4-oxalocrotonate tautomerase [Thermodesulfobacteriota bacterium]
MPIIFFYGPKLDGELVKSFTETTSKVTGNNQSVFIVYLRELSHQNVGVGGIIR